MFLNPVWDFWQNRQGPAQGRSKELGSKGANEIFLRPQAALEKLSKGANNIIISKGANNCTISKGANEIFLRPQAALEKLSKGANIVTKQKNSLGAGLSSFSRETLWARAFLCLASKRRWTAKNEKKNTASEASKSASKRAKRATQIENR